MTNKEVIEQLESLKANSLDFARQKDSEDIWSKDIEALEMAIKVLEENEKLKEERNNLLNENVRLRQFNVKLNTERNQMSAVKVLEWLSKNYDNGEYEKAFGHDYTFCDLIRKTTPQETVDKIIEYEKKKEFDAKVEEIEKLIKVFSTDDTEFTVADKHKNIIVEALEKQTPKKPRCIEDKKE